MPQLLTIHSSPNLETSITRRLTKRFVDTWVENHSNVSVEELDLAVDPLPHFGPESLAAMVVDSEDQTDEMRAAKALSDRLIAQLETADVLVIGSPMINFTICSQLKAWIDYVSIAGRTFSYSAPGVAKGHLFGKKVFVIESRGGDYADIPMGSFDFQEPLLRMLLGFLGLYDVTYIRSEGTRQRADELPFILERAEAVIAQLAA